MININNIDHNTMLPCYIAGPYIDSDINRIAFNTRRACVLGELASLHGMAAYVPHAYGITEVYGKSDESEAHTRPLAIASGLAYVRIVYRAGGSLWAIARDDGTLSSGTSNEVSMFRTFMTNDPRQQDDMLMQLVVNTWEKWRDAFINTPIEHKWELLAKYDPDITYGGV